MLRPFVVCSLFLAELPAQDVSRELRQLYAADQADRDESARQIDWQKVRQRDEQRRLRVLEIVKSAPLTAAEDYYHAAMVLQHGDQPAHYLLAHILTVAAVGKGYQQALWLSAATLDRYLDSIEKSQVFGTQSYQRGTGQPWTQEPYERDLLTDALRKEFRVPPMSEQVRRLERLNRPNQQ